MLRLWGLLCVVSIAGCHGEASRAGAAKPTTPAAAAVDAQEPPLTAKPPRPAHLHTPRPFLTAAGRGAPHSSTIDKIALTRDGKAALTRDQIGGIRVWPSLDGKHQPVPVPMRHATHLSIARHKTGFTLGFIDAAGGAHLLRLNGNGLTTLGSIPPHRPALQIEVLPGGAHAIVLAKNRNLSLVTDRAAIVGTFERARFRARLFTLAADGKSMRVMLMDSDSKKPEVTLERLTITPERAPYLQLSSTAKPFTGAAALGHASAGLSPAGKRFAFVKFSKNRRMWNVVVVDPDTGAKRTIDTKLTVSGTPSLGFIDEDRILIGGHPRGSTWLLDLTTEKVVPRPSPVGHFSRSGTPVAFAGGRRVAATQKWLFVQDGKTGKHHYVGHRPFHPASAAVSPSGTVVAWFGSFGNLFVEPLDQTKPVVHVQTPRTSAITRGAFLDDKHLLVADTLGTLQILDWQNNKVLAKTNAGGAYRSLKLSKDRTLLHVILNTSEARVYEVSPAGFGNPHLLAMRATQGGLLDAKTAGAAVVWSRDVDNKYRTYTLAELRQELDRRKVLARGDSITPRPGESLWSVGSDGSRYYSHRIGQHNGELRIYLAGKLEVSIRVPRTRRPSRLAPSPDATKLAVAWSNGPVTVYERSSGRRLWTVPVGIGVTEVTWSPDSKHVIVSGRFGGALFDAATGRKGHRTCGPAFGIHAAVPAPTFSNNTQPNLCEP